MPKVYCIIPARSGSKRIKNKNILNFYGIPLIGRTIKTARNSKIFDKVIVFYDRGSYEGVAEISEDVNEGIIVSTLGYWRQHNEGTVNSVSSGNLADMGNAPTFSDNLVEVVKL